jgi:hypothetical protein
VVVVSSGVFFSGSSRRGDEASYTSYNYNYNYYEACLVPSIDEAGSLHLRDCLPTTNDGKHQ